MRKTKQERIPIEMLRVIEQELNQMKRESRVREPTRVEAWQRVADKMTRQLFKKRRII